MFDGETRRKEEEGKSSDIIISCGGLWKKGVKSTVKRGLLASNGQSPPGGLYATRRTVVDTVHCRDVH